MAEVSFSVDLILIGGPYHGETITFASGLFEDMMNAMDKASDQEGRPFFLAEPEPDLVYLIDMYDENKRALMEGLPVQAIWQAND